MKIIILTIFLIYLSHFGQCIVDPAQKLVISDVLNKLYNIDPNSDPCNSPYTSCQIDIITGFQVVTEVNLFNYSSSEGNIYTINQDFTQLVNLTAISLRDAIEFNSSFYNNMNKLAQLEYLSVAQISIPISGNVTLPTSLKQVIIENISVQLDKGWFESRVEEFIIFSPLVGFNIPNKLSYVNSFLKTLVIPITYYSKLPINIPQYLPNVEEMVLNIYNDLNQSDYKNISISSNGVFKKLTYLHIEFINDITPQTILLDQLLLNSPVLEIFKIQGDGYGINPSIGFNDFTHIKGENNLYLELNYFSSSFFKQCNGYCFKFPKNSKFYSYQSSFPFGNIDLRNLSSFEVYQNYYEQSLPNIDNVSNNLKIRIERSIVVGDIPESYCNIFIFDLSSNQLNGTVPSCILCIGFKEARFVLPNPFSNFNASSEPYCPGFVVDQNYTNLVTTDGEGQMIVTGKNLGWGNYYNIISIIPNEKLSIIIERGIGKNIQKTITFQNNQTYTFNYSYIPPTIKQYSIIEIFDSKFFTLNGTGFNYQGENNVTINGTPITFTNAIGRSFYDDMIGFPFSQFPNLVLESKFTVSIDVAGQVSNQVTFYYFPSINITEENLVLNNTGGSIDITGSFITNNSSLISVSINGTNCLLKSYTNSKFTISYPQLEVGDDYVLTLFVGGYALKLPVTYIQGPTPSPTQTSTPTSTPTLTPTLTPTQSQTPTPTSEPNDDASLSSNLSIPSCLLITLLIIQQLV
ncbi:hypothetical protein RB653_002084 [Dictyostelium firmibasis]|uniref:Uncharacterized protein n=1 Tax=Dictyostelium firmibasis TaxID=79012 RepID=A0AAN7YSB9_9MYCE